MQQKAPWIPSIDEGKRWYPDRRTAAVRGDLHRNGGSFRWGGCLRRYTKSKRDGERPPDTRKHTVLPVSIRLKSTEKTPACVSMRAFLQPISARIYFGKTASHRKRARFVQSRGASPQAYWMSVKAAQRWGCAKRAFCGVCFLMPGGLSPSLFRFSAKGGAARLRGGCEHPPLRNRHICAVMPHASGQRPRCPHRSPPASP